MEMQALIEEIAYLLEKIKSGTATLGELEAFASATQQLNERAIILRYKAIEAKVYGSTSSVQTHESPIEEEAPKVQNEEPATEMSAPASAEESVDLSFDLFSMDDANSDFDSSSTNSTEEIQPSSETEENKEEIISEPAATFAPEVTEEIPTIEPTPTFEETQYPELDIQPEPTPVQPEAPAYAEADVQPEPTPAPAAPVSTGNEHPVIQRALRNDGSLQSRLLSVRLETLKSAFGLNERMLIIRELFGGSNDAYNEAIELLDNQPEIGPARSKVSAYARQYGWGEDNDLAIEFVQKVERRYA